MSRYYIEGVEKEVVEVKLEEYDNGVVLIVDGWEVFKLQDDGYGRLVKSINKDNNIGLKVDKEGRIKLVKD